MVMVITKQGASWLQAARILKTVQANVGDFPFKCRGLFYMLISRVLKGYTEVAQDEDLCSTCTLQIPSPAKAMRRSWNKHGINTKEMP